MLKTINLTHFLNNYNARINLTITREIENVALCGHGGLIAQQGHISLNTNLYLSQF